MMRSVLCFVLVGAIAPIAAAASIDDDFADGVRGSQWAAVIDNPSHLNLAEQNGRLELLAGPGGASGDDVLYLSNFKLSTAADFVVRLDYAFTGYTTAGALDTALAVDFGVGRDLAGTDSAAIAQGYATTSVFGTTLTGYGATVAYRTGGPPDTTAASVPLSPQTGTFEISYDSAGDDLTLRRVGSGITYTLADTVRHVWHADDLYVSFGGRGNGFEISSGQAFVDNFSVVNGTIVPEPAGLGVLASLVPMVGRRVRRRAASV